MQAFAGMVLTSPEFDPSGPLLEQQNKGVGADEPLDPRCGSTPHPSKHNMRKEQLGHHPTGVL